ETARNVVGAGRGHRVEDDRGFASLELVDGADRYIPESDGAERLAQAAHLEVVRRDDHEILWPERSGLALRVGPPGAQHAGDLAGHARGLFMRRSHVARVLHG